MYLTTVAEGDNPLTAEAAIPIQLAEEARRRHAGVIVRAWEAEHGELGFERLSRLWLSSAMAYGVDFGG